MSFAAPRSLSQVQEAFRNGEYTLSGLVDFYLNRISESDINAFVEVYADEALAKAHEVEARMRDGKAGRLAGIVMGVKDNISHKDHGVTAASKILEGFTAVYSATVIERLEAEDAIIIGRLNCDEFAMGSSNEKSVYGPTLNPVDKQRVPGGSSGASAAAVAADLCLASLGSDTGGSIRQPAAYCGVVGLKPTYGRISRHGLLAYASSFDQIGPLTHSVEDAALLLEIMAGKDEYDSTASPEPVASYSQNLNYNGKARIGYLKECVDSEGLDPEIREAFNQLKSKLEAAGHTVEPVSFPYLDYLIPAYYVLTTAEASSNLARYDGIHYGYRSPEAAGIDGTYFKSRSEGFGEEVKRRIMLGTFVLSSGYYDAYYAKGQKVRRVIREATNKLLSDHDFLLLPTTPTPAFRFGENNDNPVSMYLQDIFTVQANLAGVPAISLPLAQTGNGLPIGFQLMAPHFKEENMLAFAAHMSEICKG
ncbi:MAG: Asp-tRNA(Asn)/Glu-tRNA(Gln) amidotransferase subunit GatA [Cryomorphaceae bacterium]|nr:MAG: Asp-tRNA(Asn)/Glu-tRNA(Gln) amidotransferase subunit GatA [Cryomorphaceae bacterium]